MPGRSKAIAKRFPQVNFLNVHVTLTEKIQSYNIGAKYSPLCSKDERYGE